MEEIELRHLSEELNLKLILLQQRIAVLDELLLHASRVLDPETANFYVQVMNNYGNFFRAVIDSLKSSFYVELLSFLGVKLNKKGEIITDTYGSASVYALADNYGAKDGYMALMAKYREEICLIDEVRHYIAHARRRDDLNNLTVPGYYRIIRLLNSVSEFVMDLHDKVHGIPGWKRPHSLEAENDFANDTERLINAIATFSKSAEMRKKYADAKQKMRKETKAE